MSLINCKECNEKISKNAESCPKCGYQYSKKETSNGCFTNILIVVGFISISSFVFRNYNNAINVNNPDFVDTTTVYENPIPVYENPTPVVENPTPVATNKISKSVAEIRKEYAKTLSYDIYQGGGDLKVSVSGYNNETLELTSINMNDDAYNAFETSGFFDEYHKTFPVIVLIGNNGYKRYHPDMIQVGY